MGEAFMRRRTGGEVEWNKFSTTRQREGYYEEDRDMVGDSYSTTSTGLAVGSGYEQTDGGTYYLTGEDIVSAKDAVGYYFSTMYGGSEIIVEFTSYDESTETLYGEIVAASKFVVTGYRYVKGTKSYGTVTAKKGTYPGPGSVFDGSPAEGWCVMLESGTYYYYEMAQ